MKTFQELNEMSYESLVELAKKLLISSVKRIEEEKSVYNAKQVLKMIQDFLNKNNVEDCDASVYKGDMCLYISVNKTHEELAKEIHSAFERKQTQVNQLKKELGEV